MTLCLTFLLIKKHNRLFTRATFDENIIITLRTSKKYRHFKSCHHECTIEEIFLKNFQDNSINNEGAILKLSNG